MFEWLVSMRGILAAVDFGEAIKVAGGGFGTTFLILIILASATWIVGFIIRIATRDKKEEGTEKGEV